MPRITRESIRRIRENIRIDDVFEWLGAKVIRHSHNTMAFCPFCDDATSRNPACSLEVSRGLFYCFRCGKSGDIITAVRDHEECSFVEAVERLSQYFNVPLEYEKTGDPEEESRRHRYIAVLEDAQLEFLAQRSSKHWNNFKTQRDLTNEACNEFELGLSLYTEAPNVVKRLKEKHSREDIIGSGIAYENDEGQLILRFKNRITYPIRTAPGTLVGFGGRDITGRSKAKYVNSPESELFKKRSILYGIDRARKHISKTKAAIVCEGYMDTIALATHGFPNTVGAMGTALTTQNIKYLTNFCDKIFIALDSDEAGVSAAMRTADNIPASAVDKKIYVVSIPSDIAKDPDEFFNQRGKSSEEFQKLLENAEELFLFCVKHLVGGECGELDKLFTDNSNADTGKLNSLRETVRRKVGNFMRQHHHLTSAYQHETIATWVVDAARLIDYPRDLEHSWRVGSTATRRRDNNVGVGMGDDATLTGVFTSPATATEDLLIATLYYHPETRNVIKRNISDINTMFTSQLRRSLFEKICDGFSRGQSIDDITTDFTGEEMRECARIISMQNTGADGTTETLGEETITRLCEDMQRVNLEHAIEMESNSANPDLVKLLDMKTKLAKLNGTV